MNQELAQRAAAIHWWHGGMDLGEGVVTVGASNPTRDLLPRLKLPPRLDGLTVLDIGTWDGFIAFECERRGAKRVVATDSFVWNPAVHPAFPTGDAGFKLAHEVFHSHVEQVHCDVLDLTPEHLGTFDLVLFLGVLYHLRHPLLALEKVAAMTGDRLILETHFALPELSIPVMRFYPGSELNGDATNWWGPNPACIANLLRAAGFTSITAQHTWMDRIVFHARRPACG